MPKSQAETVCDLLRNFDTAMLVTFGQSAPSRARPMAIARVEDNGDLWFFTGRSTHKVGEVEGNHEVLVVCQKDHAQYLSVSGAAELIQDRDQARALWKESYKVWFPAGVEDPDLILIRVRAAEAESGTIEEPMGCATHLKLPKPT